jgi:spore germination protein GerM
MAFLKMKLFWKAIVIILLIVIVILGIRFLSGSEDAWICQDGQWVKHGNPGAAMPTSLCGDQKQTGEVLVATPWPNQIINSPLIVEGSAIGNWYFEARFPIELIDDQGKILGQSHVQAQSDWMTENMVLFKGEINYQVAATTTGKLVLRNDNPSGLPQNKKKFEIPVVISPSQTMAVKAFFSNNFLDPEVSCNKVFAVERLVLKTAAVAREALEQLLAGPSEQEKIQGYYTSINSGVLIQKLTIVDGIAKVDFNETLEKNAGGSCRVSAIGAQIIETLKQFSTVKDVVISINDRTEDVLQP